jgi:predicted kinase
LPSSPRTERWCARRCRWYGRAGPPIGHGSSPTRAHGSHLAERFAWDARQPGVVVFAGLSATGKTRLAGALADRAGLAQRDLPARRRSGGLLEALGGLPAASVLVECRAPLSVRLERARRRLGESGAVSDADADIVRRQAMEGDLADDFPAGQHIVLRTDRPAAEALDDLAALLDAHLARSGP